MKMSDALRGAAESAPVDDVRVETGAAARRVQRHRALRMGANGAVGVGAAALVVAGVMGAMATPVGPISAENEGAREDMAADGGAEPGIAGSPDIMLACGYAFDAAAYPTGDVGAVATIGDVADGTAQINVDYSASGDRSYTIDVPGVYVIWDGLVVANPGVAADGSLQTVGPDQPATISGSSDLVNCWDGAPLPAGDYTVVTVTPLSPAGDEAPPVDEPTTAPEPEPLEPSEMPSEQPDPGSTVDPDASVSSGAATEDIAVESPTYAVSEAVTLTVPGDAVEDPFAQYLNPEPTEPVGPDDALTSDAARAAYDAALAGKWDMAVGTQRVVKTGDNLDADSDLWATNYFGCPYEGVSGSFPSQSADLAWLGVDASIPSSVSVSYGWVVDSNPVIDYSLTNDSEWSLPGFYEGSSPRLVLVRDGRVVAEAYPVNPEQNVGGIAYATEDSKLSAEEDASLIWAPDSGYLSPGETLAGEYLWRDVSGCWTGDSQMAVTPGNYTVLTVHDVYVGGMYAIAYAEDDAARAQAEADAAEGGGMDAATIDPAYGSDDYVSFQVWTSVGTVRVTN